MTHDQFLTLENKILHMTVDSYKRVYDSIKRSDRLCDTHKELEVRIVKLENQVKVIHEYLKIK